MCRWIAYIGDTIPLDTLVTKPKRSLIEQSLYARESFRPDGTMLRTNGDGFGMGWYGEREEPGIFKVSDPAWSNENINELCAHLRSRLFMAHIRAASTGGIQRTNCHPFKYKNWMFQHNGYIDRFDEIRRDLQMAIAPEYYGLLRGTTDSETFFLLMLTHGLETDPKHAYLQSIEQVRTACKARGVEMKVILSCALSDGSALYTLRYAEGEKPHSQYYTDFEQGEAKGVIVVSEPLDDEQTGGYRWQEMPPCAYAEIKAGTVTIESLSPSCESAA